MGKFSEYKLPLQSMPEGEDNFAYHLDRQFFANMENTDVRDASVDVALTVAHRHDAYEMNFDLTGSLTVPCDRCLDDLELPVDTHYHMVVKYGEDYNDDSDDLLVIPHSETSINVAYMIYDTAVLAIPLKHVHPMGKCNRAMSSLLKKHRAHTPGDPDAALEDELLEEMDESSETPVQDLPASDSSTSEEATDPRWDALKDLRD